MSSITAKNIVFYRKILISLIFLGSFLFAPRLWAIDVIINSSVPDIELPIFKLRAIFSGRIKQWPDSKPVIVVLMRYDHPVHLSFCNNVLNIYPRKLLRSWERAVFSGTGRKPLIVETEKALIEKVKTTPGAIGYVNSADNLEGAHVIKIK